VAVMTPADIKVVTLTVGGTSETVVVQANTEVVQASTATISTTLSTNQIINLPLVTRNAMDFITMLPGVNTTGTNRASTVGGMPQNVINITIDGTNTQDNYNKSGDGFFSYIQPRLDSVQEVTMSTATPGAESSGPGAVQIKFVTRSGNNDYHGSLYEYHKNPVLDSNYWFNNRDLTPPAGADWTTWKSPVNRVLLNQYGGRLGGPISAPKWLFGPLGFSGKDKAFFFVNYEESRQPGQQTVSDVLFDPLTESQGIYQYAETNGTLHQVNLYQLAAANGVTSTEDPLIQSQLANMRASTQFGSVAPYVGAPNYQHFYWVGSYISVRKFLTTRGDFNLTSKQRLETSWNYAQYVPNVDYLNTANPSFPTGPAYGTQLGNRFSNSIALRSTLTSRLVNEFRFGFNGGTTVWFPEQTGNSAFKDMGYWIYSYPASITNYYNVSSTQRRCSPLESIDETISWTKSSHSLSIGGNWTNVGSWYYNKNLGPTIGMGVSSTSGTDPAYVMFDSTHSGTNFPKATSSQVSDALATYATLTARVNSFGGSYYLNELNNQYTYQGLTSQRSHQREVAAFASDSWRLKPNLTLNYGVRWDYQMPFVALNNIWTYATVAQVFGPYARGFQDLFSTAQNTGVVSQVNQYKAGTNAYNPDYKTFAPSFGFAWSINGSSGLMEKLFGNAGQTVVRGGYSIAYNRYGIGTYVGPFSSNPGGSLSASRSVSLGNFPQDGGAGAWPVMFRDLISGARTLTPSTLASLTPSYPITLTTANSIYAFDPNTRTPYTQSWTFGIQRELNKDMALEVRYVANRNLESIQSRSINERTMIENGFMAEFKLAMANLAANQAAGRGNNFKYYGAGTGTNPLPITLAYLNGYTAAQATDSTKYTSSSFTSSTYVNSLAKTNPAPGTYASTLYGTAAQRANAITAGLIPNFFTQNPTVGGATIYGSGGFNYYDSLVVELRRRLAKGLMVNANYVFAKSEGNTTLGFKTPYVKVVGGTLPSTFKLNWIYELPIGRGRSFLSNMGTWTDRFLGGWELQGIARIQGGNMLDLGNVNLVGMTMQDVRNMVNLRFVPDQKLIYYEPEDVRQQTILSWGTTGTSATGFSGNAPTGRYIAPANQNTTGCIQIYSGDCAPIQQFTRGPKFSRFDLSAVKKLRFTEQKNLEMRAEFLNAFNNINFSSNFCEGTGNTCGNISSAWRDVNGTAEAGGRTVQIQLRFNF